MFRTVHPNRWFLYALAAPVVLFMLMMWRIGLDVIEARAEADNQSAASNLSVLEIKRARINKLDLQNLE